jgi:hypothetical protein
MKVKQIDMTMDELLKEAASYPGVYKADFSGKPLAKDDQEKYKADNKSKYSKAEKKAGQGITLKFSAPKVEFDGSVTFEKGEEPSGLVEVLNLVLTNGVTSVEVDIAGTIEVEVAHGGNLWECTIKSVNDLALPSTITTRKIEVEGSMLSAGGRKFPFRGFFHPTGYFQEAWDTMKNDNLSKLAKLAGNEKAENYLRDFFLRHKGVVTEAEFKAMTKGLKEHGEDKQILKALKDLVADKYVKKTPQGWKWPMQMEASDKAGALKFPAPGSFVKRGDDYLFISGSMTPMPGYETGWVDSIGTLTKTSTKELAELDTWGKPMFTRIQAAGDGMSGADFFRSGWKPVNALKIPEPWKEWFRIVLKKDGFIVRLGSGDTLDELSKLAAAPPVSPVELTSAANDALMKIAKLFPGGSAAHGRVFKPGAGQVLEWDGAVKFGSGNELLMIVSWSPTRNTCVYDFQMTHRESAYEDLFPRELEEFLPTAGHAMAAYDMLRMLTQGSILKGLAAAVKRVEKAVREIADAEGRKLAKFEEGTPADPTENMSPEDAAEWHQMNDEHKDNFKAAAGMYTTVKDPNQARLAKAATAALKEIAKTLGGQITRDKWSRGSLTHTIEGENLLADREHVQFLDWSGIVKSEHLALEMNFYASPKDEGDLLNGGVQYTFSTMEYSDVPEIKKMLSNIHMLRAVNTDGSGVLKALAKTVGMAGEVADRVALFGNARKRHVSEMKFAEAFLSETWQEQVKKTFPGALSVAGRVYSDWSKDGPQRGELQATLPEEAPSNASAIMKKLVNTTLATVQQHWGVSFEVGRARKDRSRYWLPFMLVPSLGKAAASKAAKLMARQESILKKYLDEGGDARLVDDLPGDVLAALRRVKDQETLESDVDRWFSDNKKARSAASALPGDEKLSRYEEGVPADPTENMSPEDKAEWEKNTDEHKDNFKSAKVATDLAVTKGAEAEAEKLLKEIKHAGGSGTRHYHELTVQFPLSGGKFLPMTIQVWEQVYGDTDSGKFETEAKVGGMQIPVVPDRSIFKGILKGLAHISRFRAASSKEAAQGLYGFTKGVQSDCEACVRKVSRTADSIARRIWAKDENVAPFLVAHSKRASSLPAKILVGAIKKLGPQIEDEVETAEEQEPEGTAKQEKMAAKGLKYGLYGFSGKTSSLGLSAATELRELAGHVAGDLHSRRADKAEHITGFLNSHGKTAKCLYSKLLAASYPEGVTKKAASMGVSDWLAWTPVEGE